MIHSYVHTIKSNLLYGIPICTRWQVIVCRFLLVAIVRRFSSVQNRKEMQKIKKK